MIPEEEFCVLLCRSQPPPKIVSRISALLQGSLQWPRVLERARTLEILPLVCASLRNLNFHGVPDSVRTELLAIFRVNAMRNEFQGKELARLLRLLTEAKIQVITLKGITQARLLYGDPAFRDCSDIDLLVPRGEVIRAFDLVVSGSYEPVFPHKGLLELLAKYGKDYEFTREDGINRYLLDLHCGLLWGGALESPVLKEVWADSVPQNLYGIGVRGLSSDWQFLFASVHAYKHGRSSLKYLVDIDRFVSQGLFSWNSVGEKTKRLGWEDAVRYCLQQCSQLFETPEPAGYAMHSAVRTPRGIGESEVPADFLALKLLKSPAQKLHYLAIRTFIPSPEICNEWPLPESLFFMYYLLQPIRMGCKSAGWLILSTWNSLRRKGSAGIPTVDASAD